MPTLDTLIARIALSLWTSARRVEPLPTVRVWNQRDVVDIVPMRPMFEGRWSEGI